ncbi:hypothetical protein [Nocardiopsis sp. L17-MgMaSL7]|uniref:hypothetical protein n=1 Tax=Nocardiopsis sp. L17-MgMaSL7 TaxID=1938893 RepID=UPI000D71372C|nr:hypothetical protein [Nocardiopsis sp. L17-MgMaSL7]PWV44566.1 hypothetical protein BDW27_12325 [Nocardiopsis sp. L17-MgMaSL7]
MIRAIHPDLAHEGAIHADHLTEEDLDTARSRGWQITTTTTPPSELPPAADQLWQGAREAGLPWTLTQRRDPVEGHPIVVLAVHGVDPDRPDRWAEWSWVGQALDSTTQPRIPLARARVLLTA